MFPNIVLCGLKDLGGNDRPSKRLFLFISYTFQTYYFALEDLDRNATVDDDRWIKLRTIKERNEGKKETKQKWVDS